MKNPKSILITGATSGIGAALAREYAAPGVRLVLSGRDPARLESIAAEARASGATVETAILDVTNEEATVRWVKAADDASPLDLAIANAGISGGTHGGGESVAQASAIFATNLNGVVNTLHPAAERMIARGHGQIAMVSSLAGFRGIPGAPAYSTSKAAVKAWGDAMRSRLKPRGVTVSIIFPGFVRTPLTDVNQFPMPFLMEADKAAALIRRRLARGKAMIAFPWPTYLFVRLMAALPYLVSDFLYGRMPEKK
ncbi:MAG: SDR family NAD(P)-dependent oxidoreductase [Alphaproteobacteria bacterium]|nr:SDR family NAD(P)-dependent oxidoreductase [Alphaproteobacteria bacterium]